MLPVSVNVNVSGRPESHRQRKWRCPIIYGYVHIYGQNFISGIQLQIKHPNFRKLFLEPGVKAVLRKRFQGSATAPLPMMANQIVWR